MIIKTFVKQIRAAIIFLIISMIAFVFTSQNVSDYVILTSLPIKNISELLVMHLLANVSICLSTLIMGISFIRLYLFLKKRKIPFTGFLWIFGGFKLFIFSIFAMNLLSLWRVYFWADGIIRVSAAIFAVAATIAWLRSYKAMKDFKSPEEYDQLKKEIEKILKIQDEVKEIHNIKN